MPQIKVLAGSSYLESLGKELPQLSRCWQLPGPGARRTEGPIPATWPLHPQGLVRFQPLQLPLLLLRTHPDDPGELPYFKVH